MHHGILFDRRLAFSNKNWSRGFWICEKNDNPYLFFYEQSGSKFPRRPLYTLLVISRFGRQSIWRGFCEFNTQIWEKGIKFCDLSILNFILFWKESERFQISSATGKVMCESFTNECYFNVELRGKKTTAKTVYDQSCSTSDPKRSWSVKIDQMKTLQSRRLLQGLIKQREIEFGCDTLTGQYQSSSGLLRYHEFTEIYMK